MCSQISLPNLLIQVLIQGLGAPGLVLDDGSLPKVGPLRLYDWSLLVVQLAEQDGALLD